MTDTDNESRGKVLLRGVTLRCPRCGAGNLFRHWTAIIDDCPKCSLHFARESGYWVGAQAINLVCTGGAIFLAFAVMLAFTLPHVNVALTISVLAPIAILTPIVGYPFSKTNWMAVDRAILQRMDSHEHLDQ